MAGIRSSALAAAVKRWDSECGAALSSVNKGLASWLMLIVGAIGAECIFVPAGLIFAAWALYARDRRAASIVLAVTLITAGSNRLIKLFVPRRRPPIAVYRKGSFPSGHTMAAVAVYGIGANVIGGFQLASQPLVAAGALLLGMAVGLTRVARGMHWASDAVAGLVLGLAIFAAASAVLLHPALR